MTPLEILGVVSTGALAVVGGLWTLKKAWVGRAVAQRDAQQQAVAEKVEAKIEKVDIQAQIDAAEIKAQAALAEQRDKDAAQAQRDDALKNPTPETIDELLNDAGVKIEGPK